MLVTLGPLGGGGDGAFWSDLQLHFPTSVSCKQMGPLTGGLIKIACQGEGSSVGLIKAQDGARLPGF